MGSHSCQDSFGKPIIVLPLELPLHFEITLKKTKIKYIIGSTMWPNFFNINYEEKN